MTNQEHSNHPRRAPVLASFRIALPLPQVKAWRVWPLAALINFAFVPLNFRVLFINVVALCWSTFLLLQARLTNPGPAPSKPK